MGSYTNATNTFVCCVTVYETTCHGDGGETVHMTTHTKPCLLDHSGYKDKPTALWLTRHTHTHTGQITPRWGGRTVLEQCLPGELIFYSLCPSVS